MKNHFLYLALACLPFITSAQLIKKELSPIQISDAQLISANSSVILPKLDLTAIAKEDALHDALKDRPWRFGITQPINADCKTKGQWLSDGAKRIWQFEVNAPGALTLNYFFDHFYLPPSAKLFIVNKENGKYLGAITGENNNDVNQLTTWPFEGSKHLIQLEIDASELNDLKLTIAEAVHGYRNYDKDSQGEGDSDFCNRNAICPEGDIWVNQKKAVVMILSGANGYCTGTLMNNTANNGRPYVLTASHCRQSNTTSWGFRFNFQSDLCNENQLSGSLQAINGCKIRAQNDRTDFLLVEMNTTPPASFNPYYAAWNKNENNNPSTQVAIHHPRGDLKKISTNNNEATKSFYLSQSNNFPLSWKIDSWETGTTEGGSSGAPLFDQNGRVIGQLAGGLASCNNTNESDYFGRLALSFEDSENDSSKTLSYWLDPAFSNADSIDGFDPNAPLPNLDLALVQVNGVPKRICGNKVNPSIAIYNAGTSNQSNIKVTARLDGQIVFEQNNIQLNSLASLNIVIGELSLSAGMHALNINISNPSNTDASPFNNTSNINFEAIPDGNLSKVNVTIDDFGSENLWRIEDQQGNIISQAGPFKDNSRGTIISNEVCLNAACYKIVFTDLYGDGMCCEFGEGAYELRDYKGTLLAKGWNTPKNENEEAVDETTDFCVEPSGINNLIANPYRLFPNPAAELVFISGGKQQAKVQISDVMGKVILNTSLSAISNGLKLSAYAKGIYLVSIADENGSFTQKLVIE